MKRLGVRAAKVTEKCSSTFKCDQWIFASVERSHTWEDFIKRILLLGSFKPLRLPAAVQLSALSCLMICRTDPRPQHPWVPPKTKQANQKQQIKTKPSSMQLIYDAEWRKVHKKLLWCSLCINPSVAGLIGMLYWYFFPLSFAYVTVNYQLSFFL